MSRLKKRSFRTNRYRGYSTKKSFDTFFRWYFMSLWALWGYIERKEEEKSCCKAKIGPTFCGIRQLTSTAPKKVRQKIDKMSRFAVNMFDKQLCSLTKINNFKKLGHYSTSFYANRKCTLQIYDDDKHQNKDLMPTFRWRWLLFARLQIILPPLLFYKGRHVDGNCKWADSKSLLFDTKALTRLWGRWCDHKS